MSFIGIISESKNEMQIKRVLDNSLNSKCKKHTIIVINDKNIENIKNIRFETILITNINEITNKNLINYLFKNLRYLIISTDINFTRIELKDNAKLNIITFGFNQKATITVSSAEEELIICIQRKIYNIEGEVIEPQEIKLDMICKNITLNAHNSLGIASIMLIYNKK